VNTTAHLPRHIAALDTAIERARAAHLRQAKAALNTVGGEKRRQQLLATAEAARQHWSGLLGLQLAHKHLGDFAGRLLQDHQQEPHQRNLCPLCQEGAELLGALPASDVPHPFAGATYRTDQGKHQTYITDAEGRLARVPSLTAEQCQVALRLPGLQQVVRKAIERRQRQLSKAGAA
jgi:hypothetical protein